MGSEVSQATNAACSQPYVEAKKTDVKEEREKSLRDLEGLVRSRGRMKGW